MKISIIGCGYVGLVTAALLAELGHEVRCFDCNEAKIAQLTDGNVPFFEEGLQHLIVKHQQQQTISFTDEAQIAFEAPDIIFIAVGTPASETGQLDVRFLEQTEQQLLQSLKKSTVIVIKSTVPVGYNDGLQQRLTAHLPAGVVADVVSNPEFLREGQALTDAFTPDRIIIGATNDDAAQLVASLYNGIEAPILFTSRASAEMIKYASNTFLALKISYINQIANLCDKTHADINEVADGMGFDKRIGRNNLNAGIGYGGSCFPKDTQALLYTAATHQVNLSIVEAAIQANEEQRQLFLKKVVDYFNGNVQQKKIALLGLAFKPNTDDTRESPGIYLAKELQALGASVIAYDPLVKSVDIPIDIADSLEQCMNHVDAILLATEWAEFVQADWSKLTALSKHVPIFDGRNCLNKTSELVI